MKTYLLLLLTTLQLVGAPRLQLNQRPLAPETKIEIIFDQPVVPDSELGKELPNTLLTFSPDWPAKIIWKSANIAQLVPAHAPKTGTNYTVTLAKNLTHLDGSAIPGPEFKPLPTESFRALRSTRRDPLRTGGFTLAFNNTVSPTEASPFFHFTNGEHTVAAKIRRPIWGDLRNTWRYQASWEERFTGINHRRNRPPKNTELPHYLIVEPQSPLPIGKNWTLKRLPGLHGLAEGSFSIGHIHPFKVSSTYASTRVNAPRELRIRFNQSLPKSLTPEQFVKLITVEPSPKNLTASFDYRRQNVTVKGDFSSQANWQLSIPKKLSSTDGLSLDEVYTKNLTFRRLGTNVSLPSHDESQLAFGSRTYEIKSLNAESVHLRIKHLTPDQLVRAYQGYRHYTGNGPNQKRLKNLNKLPYELITGTTILDQTLTPDVPLDNTDTHPLQWDKLLPADQRFGAFFLSAVAAPAEHADLKNTKPRIVQSIIQLTDLGLAWKLTEDSAFVYTYSCHTGQPLPGVTLQLFGEDASPMEQLISNEEGLVTLPRSEKHRHLRATLGSDTHLLPYDSSLPTVSMWQFPITYSWDKPLKNKREALLFTDRSLYRPGETFHIKGIVRQLQADTLSLPSQEKPTLTISDPRGREIFSHQITLSDTGTFDHSHNLPLETVGRYQISLTYPEEIEAAQSLQDWRAKNALTSQARFTHSINVQEFKRNAFKINSSVTKEEYQLDASYYQGTPVASAAIQWYLNASPRGFYPEKFRDYLFTDHRRYDPYYWNHYFGYQEDGYHRASGGHSDNGKATLTPEGTFSFDVSLPSVEFPTPRGIHVNAEVTDARQQTLTSDAFTVVHSSDFYLGISRLDTLARVGEELPFKIVAVQPDGKPLQSSCDVTLTVTREVNHQVKSKAPNGKIRVNNEVKIEPLTSSTFTLTPSPNGFDLPFTPTLSGKHIFTLTTQDASGRKVQTTITRHVYGTDEYTWAYEPGIRVKLVSEQKRYQAGDTARILVLTPIEGKALVTVEREGVLRHFQTTLTLDNPVIEVPLTEADAPNTFISVLVVKGSQDSKRKNPMPALRLGYCELTVDPAKARLQVSIETSQKETLPGQAIHTSTTVLDHQGNPAANTEVTFYAEDEGTLAVIGYQNPNPLSHFYAPRPLQLRSGTSLGNFIPESPKERYHMNKGFIIGGGDAFAESSAAPLQSLRSDFNPCATWAPSLKTDASGKIHHSFTAPDTLTTYRLIAVAHQDADRFGTGTSKAIVNKPVMLEPAPPQFAHQGDHLHPKALLQNNTNQEGTWEVTLQLDSLTGSGTPNSDNQHKLLTKTISLPAKGQGTVSFDVHFHQTGDAKWIWNAKPVSGQPASFSDSVESTFPVRYPMPLLRESRYLTLNSPDKSHNLLENFTPALLDGKGEVTLTFARSRLLEAGDAIDYLLQYPYGCVEQTTSSTIPWIAAKNLRHLTPKFQNKSPEQIARAVQAGANRLLTMQTSSGGLAYWPGGHKPEPWASSYGGLGLALCQEAGADIPQSALDQLASYLSKELRDSKQTLENQARAIYVLSLFEKPETSYLNKLLEAPEKLSPQALSYLALASKDEKLLELKGSSEKKTHWMRHRSPEALHLLACATLKPNNERTEEALVKLLQTRAPQGHWRTTWCNGWSLLAMGAYAKNTELNASEIHLTLTTPDGDQNITIPSDRASHSVTLPIYHDLTLSAKSDSRLYLHSQLAAKPRIAPIQPVSPSGLQVTRRYERIKSDGSSEPFTTPKLGDLIKVTLKVTLPEDYMRYLAIDDPLPSSFEAINTQLTSQAGRIKNENSWRVSHQEVRKDRVLFFINQAKRKSSQELTYHARITQPGQVFIPPTKVEQMYDPENYALSASTTLLTQ